MGFKTYKIPDSLESKYHGIGYGICITNLDGNIIDFAYFSDHGIDIETPLDIYELIENSEEYPEFQKLVREKQILGSVSVGMISGWEFTVL